MQNIQNISFFFFPQTKSEAGLFLLCLYLTVCAHLVRSLCILKGGKQCGSYTDCLNRGKKGWECSFSPAEMLPYLQEKVQGSAWIKQSSGGVCWVGKAPGCAHPSLEDFKECENPKVLKWRSMEQILSKKPQMNCLY